MLPSAMVDRRLALETKDWLQILDLSLSQDVALIQFSIGWMNQNEAMYIQVTKNHRKSCTCKVILLVVRDRVQVL